MAFNDIDMYHLKLLLTFIFIAISFLSKFNSRSVLLCVLTLWIVGWGTSPYSTTDYIYGYLNNLTLYSDSWYGVEGAPSRAVDGIRVVEGFSWRLMYLVDLIFGYEATLQIFFGFFQLASYWYFLSSLGLRGRSFGLAMILMPISTSFVLATDWYLRQGFSWAIFLIAAGFFYRERIVLYRYLGFIIFLMIAFIFHSTTLIYFLMLIGASIAIYIPIIKMDFKFSDITNLVILFILSIAVIIPFKMGFNFDIFSGISLAHIEIYKDSQWSGVSPGFIFSFYFFCILYVIWSAGKVKSKELKIFGLFLFFILLIVGLFSMTNSLATRLLMPFPIMIIAALLFCLDQYKIMNIRRLYILNSAIVYLMGILFIVIYYIFIVIENGGMERF